MDAQGMWSGPGGVSSMLKQQECGLVAVSPALRRDQYCMRKHAPPALQRRARPGSRGCPGIERRAARTTATARRRCISAQCARRPPREVAPIFAAAATLRCVLSPLTPSPPTHNDAKQDPLYRPNHYISMMELRELTLVRLKRFLDARFFSIRDYLRGALRAAYASGAAAAWGQGGPATRGVAEAAGRAAAEGGRAAAGGGRAERDNRPGAAAGGRAFLLCSRHATNHPAHSQSQSHQPHQPHQQRTDPRKFQAALECLSFCDYSLAIKCGVHMTL